MTLQFGGQRAARRSEPHRTARQAARQSKRSSPSGARTSHCGPPPLTKKMVSDHSTSGLILTKRFPVVRTTRRPRMKIVQGWPKLLSPETVELTDEATTDHAKAVAAPWGARSGGGGRAAGAALRVPRTNAGSYVPLRVGRPLTTRGGLARAPAAD
jgi:hypothetical protein